MDPCLGKGGGSSGCWGLSAACVPEVVSLLCCISLSSESGEAGCDGEESGERAEEKGNRVEMKM